MHVWWAFTTVLFNMVSTMASAQTPNGLPVAALPIVQWEKYTDPTEGAFRVDMPQGWRVSGETTRRNALQYRNWGKAVSPDGQTILAINDPNEWSYFVPTPMLDATGFHEGSLYNGGLGMVYTVARYQTGQQFAVTWGQRKLTELCRAIKLIGSRSRPELSQEINTYSQPLGIIHNIGESTFTCEKGDLAMIANVLASTTFIAVPPGGGIWYADAIEAFLAPAQVAGMAAGLLAHMVSSVEVNPEWVARTTQTSGDVSRVAAQTNAAISNSIIHSWEARGAVMDRVMEEGSRARLGIDIYADPGTGTKYTVANNHRYYWVNPGGTVLGTDTDTPPSSDFQRMNRVPPQ
jgi:hypothetical protein